MSNVPIFEGDSLLLAVYRADREFGLGFAYRGNDAPFGVFEPKIPTWPVGDKNYPDSDVEVVCADSTPFRAAFRALSPRSKSSYQVRYNPDGSANFYVAEQDRRRFLAATGYIAVSNAADFVVTELTAPPGWPDQAVIRPPELRSEKSIEPQFIIKIRYPDLAELFRAEAPGFSLDYK